MKLEPTSEAPVQALARALAAEVVAVRVCFEELDQTVQLSHAVLQRCAGETPFKVGDHVEDGAGGAVAGETWMSGGEGG